MVELAAVFAIFGLLALGYVLNGYALTVLWTWFVVPTFGAPALGLAQAIGLAVVVSYLTHQYSAKSDKKTDWSETAAFIIVKPAFALLVGWIVKQRM